jgi:hypothetical protein
MPGGTNETSQKSQHKTTWEPISMYVYVCKKKEKKKSKRKEKV